MKLNPEGVEKAARAVCRQVGDDAEELNVFHHEIATAALTAYFDHLKEVGLMKDAGGQELVLGWIASTCPHSVFYNEGDFPCAIIRAEEE